MRLGDGREVPTTEELPDGAGRYNRYACPLGHKLLSLDIDEGVTPMLVMCPDHDGRVAESEFYTIRRPIMPSNFPVRMIWRRPIDRDLAEASPEMLDHYERGGLLREWTPDKPRPIDEWRTSGRHG